jgi:hypothetical protein
MIGSIAGAVLIRMAIPPRLKDKLSQNSSSLLARPR